MNLKQFSRDALMTLCREQDRELSVLRARVAEAEGARERAEAAARSAWGFAREMMRRH